MIRYLVVALILVAGSCSHRATSEVPKPDPVVPKPDFEAQRYAVYSAVLQLKLVKSKTELLVIDDYTSMDDSGSKEPNYLAAGLGGNFSGLVDDFKAQNVKSSPVENKFGLPVSVTLISEAAVDKLFCEGCGWWKEFYKRYPKSDGMISFSNVGFNHDATAALVYFGDSCGGLCGTGYVILLTKDNDNWKIERSSLEWVS